VNPCECIQAIRKALDDPRSENVAIAHEALKALALWQAELDALVTSQRASIAALERELSWLRTRGC
jgi:hypothetical protein